MYDAEEIPELGIPLSSSHVQLDGFYLISFTNELYF